MCLSISSITILKRHEVPEAEKTLPFDSMTRAAHKHLIHFNFLSPPVWKAILVFGRRMTADNQKSDFGGHARPENNIAM
jgi:hypothetical protein